MKVAPIVAVMKQRPAVFHPIVLHTGQHYDAAMSDAFLSDLDLPQPDVYLGVGSASHAAQTAAVMERFEPVVLEEKPDWVLVVGDVNSTLACALVSVKLGVKVGDGQLVPAGSIIVRQRGMTFLAGTGTGLGSDYTVFATVTGKVKFEHATKSKKRIRVEAVETTAASAEL